MLHRSNTDRKWCGNSTTKPGTNPITTTGTPASTPSRTTGGPTPSRTTGGPTGDLDYLISMRRRAALLVRTGERGTIYLAVNPNIRKHEHWPKSLAKITHNLRPAEVHTFTTRWPEKDCATRYVAEWDDYADGLTGLVVAVGKLGFAGGGIMREIESARLRGLPILVQTPTRQVPLIDCTIRPTGDPRRWCAMKIEVPTPGRKPSDTLTATLAAMGARPVTR